MAKILFVAVNARYNHTCLAVRSISGYIGKHWDTRFPQEQMPEISFGEWTINQPLLDILRGIAAQHPGLVLFSVYIWNVELILRLIPELPKVIPGCVIGAGGPEAGYRAVQLLTAVPKLGLVVCGEGEETCLELVHLYSQYGGRRSLTNVPEVNAGFLSEAAGIAGIYTKSLAKDTSSAVPRVQTGGPRSVLPDLEGLAFPYPEITDPDNRIYYYESSRGCPFSCAYCLSSTDRHVRFMPLDRVCADLQRFLDARVKLVKFVDRTYNINTDRYVAIWKYIVQHHNGCTMFHFEIEAEYLDCTALDFLQSVPSGIMQFEIGVQSTNPDTLQAVGRSSAIEALFSNIRKIPDTIHLHLDLIAGLPFEDLNLFGKSFDDVLALHPDMLQLGFLKVLFGTRMADYCRGHGWKWMESPPYEVLSTPYLRYEDILFLKDTEVLLDIFWNSGTFRSFISYIGKKESLWAFFSDFVIWCRIRGLFAMPHTVSIWFTYAESYCRTCRWHDALYELLRFDFLLSGKKGNFPGWFIHNYSKAAHQAALEKYSDIHSSRLAYACSEYDTFSINPFDPERSEPGRKYAVLFLYPIRGEKLSEKIRIVQI